MDSARPSELPSPEILASKRPGLLITASSRASTNHPEINEDNAGHDPLYGIAMVLDGVGGLTDGHIASTIAKNVLFERLKLIPLDASPEYVKEAIERVLKQASDRVFEKAPTSGSTAVVAKFLEANGEKIAIIGSVGDSRAYILKRGI